MEITADNIAYLLPYIREKLCDCSWFAVDLEFSGIDHQTSDGKEVFSAAMQRVSTPPSELYAARLEQLKKYSIIQIGFSIFNEVPAAAATTENASASKYEAKSCSAYLDAKMKGVLATIPSDYQEYYLTQMRALGSAVQNTDSLDELINDAMVFLADAQGELSRIAQSASAEPPISETNAASPKKVCEAASKRENKVPLLELAHRRRFLTNLSSYIFQWIVEAQQTQAKAAAETVSPPSDAHQQNLQQMPAIPPVTYQADTFYAYMFPAEGSVLDDVQLNVNTVNFLNTNKMDFQRWIAEGLRYAPLTDAVAANVDYAKELANLGRRLCPAQYIEGCTAALGALLVEFLPLSNREVEFIEVAIEIMKARSGYVRNVIPLLRLSRGQAVDDSEFSMFFLSGSIYTLEMRGLAAIGVVKRMRKFILASAPTLGTTDKRNLPGSELLQTLLYAAMIRRTPMVVHNGFVDLVFLLLATYGSTGAPATLVEWKRLVAANFPVLYDTRTLSCVPALQHLDNFTSQLHRTFAAMKKVPGVAKAVQITFDRLLPGGIDAAEALSCHNAGCDAYMTGALFAYVSAALRLAQTNRENYANILPVYGSVYSIYLHKDMDGLLGGVNKSVFFLMGGKGIAVSGIREVLRRMSVVALVMYCGDGFIISIIDSQISTGEFLERFPKEVEAVATGIPQLELITLPHQVA